MERFWFEKKKLKMGGSQLKSLKATLKANNLTGQTNAKKKKGTKRQPKAYDREEREQVIAKIREQFSPFEIKASRNKQGQEKMIPVGKPGISKQVGEEQRQRAFEARRAQKNRQGGLLDRRFGERSKGLTEEEKMLERFTRVRQSQSKSKQNLFDLTDNDDMFGSKLTHLGQTLEDNFDSGDLGIEGDEESQLSSSKRAHEESLGESQLIPRKKTKAEVMKEVIAKSKFYRQQKQQAQEKREDQIEELDEDFEDIMSELRNSNAQQVSKGQTKESKDKEYDVKVKELLMERRAAPADRTKTELELQQEAEEKRKKLEQQRIDRMSGIVVEENGEERGVEDLDDDFWGGSEEEGGDSDGDGIADSDEDIQLGSDDEGSLIRSSLQEISCPGNHEEFLELIKGPLSSHPKITKLIIKAYQPKLAEGNKERLGRFAGVLLRHMIFLSKQNYVSNIPEFTEVQNSLMSILKMMSEKYNQAISDTCRSIISEIQKRFKSNQFSGLSVGDLVFFTIVGSLFSTSDQYHLIVTPCSILLAEFLEQIKFNTLQRLAYGAILVRLSLQYQRISKRYVPEVTYFLEKSIATFLPGKDSTNIKVDTTGLEIPESQVFPENGSSVLHLHQIFDSSSSERDLQTCTFLNILDSLQTIVTAIWKDLPAFNEVSGDIEQLLRQVCQKFPTLKQAQQISETIQKIKKSNEHYPLALQDHKPLAIPSHAPKFEDNFNPERKSYDPSRTRNEINKMKAQLKKDRKFTMKEIRKDTKFEARQKVDEDKKNAANYHAKMAQIVNTISTEEGAEKNKYDRERKLRSGKK